MSSAGRTNPIVLLGIGLVSGVLISLAVARINKSSDKGKDAAADSGDARMGAALPSPPASSVPLPEPMFTVSASPIGASPKTPPSPSMDKAIQAERANLDLVRAALEKGDAPKALSLLDRHDRDYGAGIFSPDARILRIEALAATGKNEEALVKADEFLESFPHSPQADKVRALVSKLRARDH